jgi:hypothetical protein
MQNQAGTRRQPISQKIAAVMLVLEERGLEHARVNLLKCFNPAGSFFITSFCLFEALGVLKRKC